MTDITDELIVLERTAEEERAKLAGLSGEEYDLQWRRWRHATEAVQTAIDKHAGATGQNRGEIEQAVARAVRRADEDPAE
jgi:uncharacterized protein YukE